MRLAHNLLTLNASPYTFLMKTHTKILLMVDRDGKIPVKKWEQLFVHFVQVLEEKCASLAFKVATLDRNQRFFRLLMFSISRPSFLARLSYPSECFRRRLRVLFIVLTGSGGEGEEKSRLRIGKSRWRRLLSFLNCFDVLFPSSLFSSSTAFPTANITSTFAPRCSFPQNAYGMCFLSFILWRICSSADTCVCLLTVF